MDRKHSGGINIGTSSILVTFVLLALVTFAALSYMSARSDYVLSKEAADRTASYYDANRMAEIYLANIEALLSKHKSRCDGEKEYIEGVNDLFADNEKIEVSDGEDGSKKLSYVIAVTNGQNLSVVLTVHYPDINDDSLFKIEKWSTSVNRQWLDSVKKGSEGESGTKLLF
ncbi:MAG: hypothetical protein IJ171_03400 [Ruminococcus sp.]|nr:hypothetical protein [Ruminococcus sp.]MBR1909194.1 hypothetical protein [Lachnospiraceae bacterium]